ncbi:MAG: C4-dicarboxylate ABC transporter [Candidatus Rokubacteria bacterium RIFCSPHIGHO2_12_FULL_73_22]|nr:MAG: C4-dicarboxylate ABC transporter [Candidatus Rokubacteria bacterium RIFCSPHIGHO2_02_FULL_73_26]OGK99964.1 MAG: C4-dicarboxylate ABC transporter [Candidatus Rokubacteria bacterium RIFCSPHIGHO2_12_FULL_73_22]OGL13469.1 MAG: C4-dicarboxylate ABC transporter [Candidatus Rokubacteria bacterium RIFCSPLOWO2_02_FULL_73_56]OGL27866.1 MAG: C4-dicarboxylate ABC transporter [Candidatus Rokubacteria bacterium RIFCSPLOWO2_12_FULL_73_47]
MTLVARLIAVLGTVALLASGPLPATAQQVTLRVHQFLPARAPVPSNFIAPWAKKVEADSKGRIKVELYPSMQLGGTPPQLFDQVKDGVVDVVWTLPGYTPGRFPRSEAFELPFIAGNGEQTSQAAWEYYQKHLKDELKDVHIIAVHTHGPGLLHVKGNGVRKLEDMKGLKLRGPSRQVNKLLETLGATPVGMPVPAMPDALSKGVIDGTVVPWEVTLPLRVAELVNTHTSFSGNRSLYVSIFVFAMNKAKYASLPPDLKQVIDANSGPSTSQWVGRVMDQGDAPGLAAAKKRGNAIVVLDARETARWKAVAQQVTDAWIAEMKARGIDGQALVDDARKLIAKHAGPAD